MRDEIGTPLFENATKVLLLGGGELGKEIVIEAQRLGVETIVVDRYMNAPAMQVSHKSYILNMTDGEGLKAIIRRERPDVIIPEIEAINTDALIEMERGGFFVIPNAKATKITMNRELLRKLAEKAGVQTSKYEFANSLEEAEEVCERIGYPCIMKAIMSSSGLGSTLINEKKEVRSGYLNAQTKARTRSDKVIIEEFVSFDFEVTELPIRHYKEDKIITSFCKPIAHRRPGTHYHESWQPASISEKTERRIYETAKKITDELGGLGIFGCELFIKGEDVYFNEISPRPHDTGMVTLITQGLSEMALHLRAVLELPIPEIELLTPGAAHVILSEEEGKWGIKYKGISKALSIPGVNIRLFGKPNTYKERRMGLALAKGKTTDEARRKAEEAAHIIEAEME